MKAACFGIMALLVAALVNATPVVVYSASSTPSGLAGGIKVILGKVSGRWGADKRLLSPVGNGHQAAATRVRTQVGTNEDLHLNKVCITRENCKKKKVICFKKCWKQHGDINKKHIRKCFVRCRKCVPNC